MSLLGWVTTHTGLPALYAVGSGRLTASDSLSPFPRLIANVVGSVLVSDPGAYVGVDVTYAFGADSVVLRRPGVAGDAHQWVTSADGLVVADVYLIGDDERHYDTGARVFTSALGRQVPRYSLGQQPPTGTLEFLTTGAGTSTLRGFVAVRSPLWVVHNEAACQIPGCDVEGARLVVPHSMREVRSARTDVAQRVWSVEYSRVPDSLADLGAASPVGGPVVTWGQWEAWAKKYSPKGWQDWSEIRVAQRVTGMPQI